MFVLAAGGGAAWVLAHRMPVVLLYHEIAPEPKHLLGITPDVFERQLAWLDEDGYRIVALSDVVAEIEAGRPVPASWIALTFDDSLRATAEWAAPILRRHGARATFFIGSADPGHEGRLTWDDVRAFPQSGIAVGGHSRTHPWLPDLPDAEVAHEIGDDRRALERELGANVEFFAYPYGAMDARIAAAARQAGYRAAFAVTPGVAFGTADRFALRRSAVGPSSADPWIFRTLVSGYRPALKEGLCALFGIASPLRPGGRLGAVAWLRFGAVGAAGLAWLGWAAWTLRGWWSGRKGARPCYVLTCPPRRR